MAAIEYEIFNDLLDVILSLTAIAVAVVTIVVASLGVGIYKILSYRLKKDAISAAKIEMYKALVLYHISCGFDYWMGYKQMDHLFSMDSVSEVELNGGIIPVELKNKFKNEHIPLSGTISIKKEKEDGWEITDKGKNNIFVVRKEEGTPHIYKRDIMVLNRAIETTKLGYNNYAGRLEEEPENEWLEQKQGGKSLICQIRNNLAYYYAERHRFGKAEPNDAADAQEFAEYVNKEKHKYPEYILTYSETYEFVNKEFR